MVLAWNQLLFRAVVVWALGLILLVPQALGAAGSGANKADELASARTTLLEAVENEKARPGKASALAVEAALDAYNSLAAVRRSELDRSLRRLDRQISRLSLEGVRPDASAQATDSSSSVQRWLPEGLELRYLAMLADRRELGTARPGLLPRATLESEPNDTPGEATPLDVAVQPVAIGSGLIATAGDTDYYSIVVPADSTVWAYVDTGGTPLGTSNDSVLTMFGQDGVSELESDDDDGTGNGCNSTIESLAASAIAGRQVLAAGTYYLRVTAASPTDTINPYQLYVCALSANAVVPEVENNDSPSTANTILGTSAVAGARSGLVSSPSDVDLFVFPVAAGTPLYISLDCDPERDGGADLAVDLLTPDGQTVLLTGDSSGSAVAAGEAFCFVAPTTDRYLVRVRHASAGTRVHGPAPTYRVLVAETELEGRCPPTILHGMLGSGSADYPGVSGTHVGRLTRNGRISSCNSPKTCPGLFDPLGLRTFDSYSFSNTGTAPACVQISFTPSGCSTPGLFACVYSGSFDPDDLCANYLGDLGFSLAGNFTAQFSVTLNPGESAVLVLSEVDPGASVGCTYSVAVNGIVCASTVPYDVCMRDDETSAVFKAYVGDRDSQDYGRWEYRSASEFLCGRAETVNYVRGRSLSMRDRSASDNGGCVIGSMQAQFDFGRQVAVVQIILPDGRAITLRDRRLSDSGCGP